MRSVAAALRLGRKEAAPVRCCLLRRPYPGYSRGLSSALDGGRSRRDDRSSVRSLCSGGSGGSSSGGGKLKVVLDMDECMIHSTDWADSVSDLPL